MYSSIECTKHVLFETGSLAWLQIMAGKIPPGVMATSNSRQNSRSDIIMSCKRCYACHRVLLTCKAGA